MTLETLVSICVACIHYLVLGACMIDNSDINISPRNLLLNTIVINTFSPLMYYATIKLFNVENISFTNPFLVLYSSISLILYIIAMNEILFRLGQKLIKLLSR